METEKISYNDHKELLRLLKPFVDFMDSNGYSYLLLAGKDGKCARYLNGTVADMSGMIADMAQKHKTVKKMFEHSLKLK